MGATSFWHIAIVALVIVLLFGRGKISDLMGDVAKGIKSFKRGMSEDDAVEDPRTVEHRLDDPVTAPTEKVRKG